jgi:superfamily I DNA/RNA helicase
MKLYQIFGGQFPHTDVIIVEEYQDINSVQAHIIAQQEAFIVAIGDIYQDIYSWRGSGEFIEIVRKERWPELALTTSFRVNPKDAKLANKLLSYLGCGNAELKGVSKKQEVETTAYLFRTNAAALLTASQLLDEDEEFKLTLDLKAIWDELWYVHFLLQNKVQGKKAPATIGWIKTKEAFLKAIEFSSEIKRYHSLYTLIAQKQGGLYGMQQKFNKLAEDTENKVLPITISTCHKAKGLEWDLVVLGGDLYEETENFGNHEGAKPESEYLEFLRLLYISVTRAKVRTEMSQELYQYIAYLS